MAVIETAVARFQARDPEKPRRGRKPVKEDVYISTSQIKIEEMEMNLKTDKTLTTTQRDALRNKASALRSRVNKKLENRLSLSKIDIMDKKASELFQIMVNEMDSETVQRCMAQVLGMLPAAQPAAGNKRARKSKLSATTPVANKANLVNKMTEFFHQKD